MFLLAVSSPVSLIRLAFPIEYDAFDLDLYLLRPPPDALHAAVNPSQIIICGDSAGGGIILGLLQIIRDAGLPLPAGGVLISPWGDLTHSFPSVFENTATVGLFLLLCDSTSMGLGRSRMSYHPTGLVFIALQPYGLPLLMIWGPK